MTKGSTTTAATPARFMSSAVGEQQLFTTQAQLVTAEHDTAIAEFNVAAAIGRLIAPELRPPVRLYDMDRYYKTVKDKWIGFAGGLKE